MRRVSLYTINKEDILAGNSSEVSYYHPPFDNLHMMRPRNPDGIEEVRDDYILHTERIPIRDIRWFRNGVEDAALVAIHPEVYDILFTSMKAEVREAEEALEPLNRDLKRSQEQVCNLTLRVEELERRERVLRQRNVRFTEAPLWRRVLVALFPSMFINI